MVQLQPDVMTRPCSCTRPAPERVKIAIVLQDNVAWLRKRQAIDHHVACEQQACPTFCPDAVEVLECRRGTVVGGTNPLTNGAIGKSVGQYSSAGEPKG